MVQPRKRAATGLQSNKQKQPKHQDIKVWSESNDLFDDLNEETTSDAVENPEDQEPASDNEDMMDDQLDMEDDKPKSLLDTPDVAKRFRDFYMAKLTQAFPNDLDQIRQEENFDHNKLEILIDSLEAGVDIFSDMEKNFAILSS
ncbi:unnamed protein product [Umbelopsis sp. WA50703]